MAEHCNVLVQANNLADRIIVVRYYMSTWPLIFIRLQIFACYLCQF